MLNSSGAHDLTSFIILSWNMDITSVTRAYGRNFAITVEMQKYSPALYNMHNIVVWKYELSLQSNHTARVRAQTLISL